MILRGWFLLTFLFAGSVEFLQVEESLAGGVEGFGGGLGFAGALAFEDVASSVEGIVFALGIASRQY
jgi:hypothetical protein